MSLFLIFIDRSGQQEAGNIPAQSPEAPNPEVLLGADVSGLQTP